MISKLKMAGSGILLSILGVTGCNGIDLQKVNGIDLQKVIDESTAIIFKDNGKASVPKIKGVTKAYVDAADGEINEDELRNAVISTCIEGSKKRINNKDLVNIIESAGEVSEQDESIYSINDFTSRMIKNISKHGYKEVIRLLDRLDNLADSDKDTSEDFADAATYILDICKEKEISVNAFLNLADYVSELDNNDVLFHKGNDDNSVLDFEYLMSRIVGSLRSDDAYGEVLLLRRIAKTLDDKCRYFNNDNARGVGRGLLRLSKLYSSSGRSVNAYLSDLRVIADDRCEKISYFADTMEHKILRRKNFAANMKEKISRKKNSANPHKLGKETTLVRKKPVKKVGEKPKAKEKKTLIYDSLESYLESYRPIALEQYKDFDGKKVRIAAVPVAQSTDFSKIYILKLQDDKKMLDCVYSGNASGVKLGLVYNDMQLVINENINASTKRRIFVYGTLEDNLLHIDIIKALKDIRRLR